MQKVIITGYCGLLAAVMTGTGEFILHYDSLGRFAGQYDFFIGITNQRSTIGHFIAVLGAPLYLVGCWHIQIMLRPANKLWALSAFYVAAYGFAVGAVWIGSRSSISALANLPLTPETLQLINLYELRYESLLQVIRFSVLLLSIIQVKLILSGFSHYPKWMALLNPILLILASFLIYALLPSIGKYLMPIALNVAFFIFFAASILIAKTKGL